MESESIVKEKSSFVEKFERFQNIAEISIFIGWLTATVLMLLFGSGMYRIFFEIASIGLLGISLFNIITAIGFSASKQGRFSTVSLIVRIALGILAMLGLAFSLFAQGIKIQ